ncbi:MAG: hypothetical protein E7477_04430 [Ruminococcaceae bacterium]|nr:hypothetical protein [Oscillospiraceae bacterium]
MTYKNVVRSFLCFMKKYFFFIPFLLLFLCFSCSEPELLIDQYYIEKNDIELRLKDTGLSEKERYDLQDELSSVNKKINNTLYHFAVNILPDSLSLDSIPYSSDDISKIGEWYYENLIYPLYCYESDYASISINKEENFNSQEKFYIISYHLLRKYNSLLTEKYSFLTVSSESMSRLSFELFGEDIDSSSVMQYSSKTDRYSIPFPNNESRLLTPILSSSKLKDVTKTEISVSYAERSLSKSIYSEIFVFERKEDKNFNLYSRVRNNQSVSLLDYDFSDISEDEIYILDLSTTIPQKIKEKDLKLKGSLLSEHYGVLIDNYSGTICSYDDLSVSSLLNMFLLMHEGIEIIIDETIDSYSYFGIPVDYVHEQASLFFKNDSFDFITSEAYYAPLDVYLYKISDVSRVSYNKQVLDVLELENGCIRLETALFHPSNFIQLIAKEVVIFEPKSDGSYYIKSRHYNMHTASPINVFVADIVPSFPESFPNTSSSEIVKGTWLYENYGSLIDFDFDSTDNLSSEKLANFALERIFETEEFKNISSFSDNFAFPKSLIEEQIKLFFGETNFIAEYVSFYDHNTECFYVNPWSVKHKETSGSVIRAGSFDEGNFTVYVEDKKDNNKIRPSQYVLTFEERPNKSFRFVSAVTLK